MVKLVYIAHQISGNVDKNVREILKICKEVHTQDIIPITPYLVTVQYLEDHLEDERKLGISANKEHFERKVMDEIWLCGPTISTGMKEEIKLSLEYGIPIKCHNPNLQPVLDELIKHFREGRKYK